MAVLQQISRWAIRTLRQLGYLEAGIDAAMLAHAARADLCWRLGRTADASASYFARLFDVVFLHDALMYMTTPQELRQALETAFLHCQPGGMALFVPDHVRETFQPSTAHGGQDGASRGLRYLEWAYDPDDTDTMYTVEFAYLLREGKQPARMEYDSHIYGLFPHAEWLRLLRAVGFAPEIRRDPYGRDIFVPGMTSAAAILLPAAGRSHLPAPRPLENAT